jgi:hypothetical protein
MNARKEGRVNTRTPEPMEPAGVLGPLELRGLDHPAQRLAEAGQTGCPPARVVGFIALSDLLRARVKQAGETQDLSSWT